MITARSRSFSANLRSAGVLLAAISALAGLVLTVPASARADDGGAPTWTFENDPIGSVPAGCATPRFNAPAAVSDRYAFEGTHSLRVDDESSTSMTSVSCSQPAQNGVALSMEVYPAALPHGFLVDLFGDYRAISGQQAVFHLLADNTGALLWYDASSWTQLAPAGTVQLGQWNKVELIVPSDRSVVHVVVGGRWVGDGGPRGVRDITDINGFGISSDGTAPAGDDVYVDDVAYGQAVDTPPPGYESSVDVAAPVTVASSATPVQMPNTAVVVPHGSGHRVLLSYPAHTDNSATSGNVLAYSDDGGQTWTQGQSMNPMPAAPSFNMTLLRNGDLLALDYHTYMVAGSQNLQAEVDSSISHDGGATWIARAGTMTSPQAMRYISSTTDRPGEPLGGFVLVHNVVEDPDGTLYQSGYGYYAGDQKYRQIVMVSHDEGLNWTIRSTVAFNPTLTSKGGYEGFCEGAIERVADGSLLTVMRIGSYLPMYYARSTDNGMTWTAPQPLVAGANDQQVLSVYPTMMLMPGGSLVLLTGRPGLSLLVSPDGSGHSWTRPVEADYQNSANGTFIPTDANHLLLFGDRGSDWSTPRPAPFSIWVRQVTVHQQCGRTVRGTYRGPLVAGPEGLCVEDADIHGPVTVSTGGRLIASNSTLRGPVSVTGATAVALCGDEIFGPVTVADATGVVRLGDTTRGCDPDAVRGPVQVSGNSASVVVDRLTVAGPVRVDANSSTVATVLSGTTISGPLLCADNAVAPTDSGVPMTVDGPATGQCSELR